MSYLRCLRHMSYLYASDQGMCPISTTTRARCASVVIGKRLCRQRWDVQTLSRSDAKYSNIRAWGVGVEKVCCSQTISCGSVAPPATQMGMLPRTRLESLGCRIEQKALCADVQLWYCGTYVIMDSAYQLHKEYNATCQAACVDSAAGLSLPSQYYWAVSDWGTCSATCDGGVQTRTVSCMNSIDGS